MPAWFDRLADRLGDTPEKRAARGADRGGFAGAVARRTSGHEVGPLALLDDGRVTFKPLRDTYRTADVATVRASVVRAGRTVGVLVGGIVPVGPVGVGLGGTLARDEVEIAVEHTDGRVPWRARYRGADAHRAVHLVDLINAAAAAAR